MIQYTHMKKLLTSRTNWTVLVMFLIGGVEAIASVIPAGLLPIILGGLGLLATYFKMNPSQEYGSRYS